MIQVGVSQDDRGDRIGRDGKWCPVSQTKLLETLEQPAVDEDAVIARFEKVM